MPARKTDSNKIFNIRPRKTVQKDLTLCSVSTFVTRTYTLNPLAGILFFHFRDIFALQKTIIGFIIQGYTHRRRGIDKKKTQLILFMEGFDVAKKTKKKVKSAKKTARPKAAKKKAAAKKKTAVKKKTKKAVVKKTKAKKKTAAKPKAKKASVTKKAKKPVAKKKTARAKKKSTLTPKQIEHFREMLLLKRAEILGDVEFMEEEALKKSRLEAGGDLSSMPIHMADMGTDNFEQEFTLGLMDSERKLVNEITAAIWRIEEGVYGICEGTNTPISKPRLEANPWAICHNGRKRNRHRRRKSL